MEKHRRPYESPFGSGKQPKGDRKLLPLDPDRLSATQIDLIKRLYTEARWPLSQIREALGTNYEKLRIILDKQADPPRPRGPQPGKQDREG